MINGMKIAWKIKNYQFKEKAAKRWEVSFYNCSKKNKQKRDCKSAPYLYKLVLIKC